MGALLSRVTVGADFETQWSHVVKMSHVVTRGQVTGCSTYGLHSYQECSCNVECTHLQSQSHYFVPKSKYSKSNKSGISNVFYLQSVFTFFWDTKGVTLYIICK